MVDVSDRLLEVLLALTAAEGGDALAQWLARHADVVVPRRLVSGAARSTLRTWLSGLLDELAAARRRTLWKALTAEFPRLVAARRSGESTAGSPPDRKAGKKAAQKAGKKAAAPRKATKKAGAPLRDGRGLVRVRARPVGEMTELPDVAFDSDDELAEESGTKTRRRPPRQRPQGPQPSGDPAAVYFNAWFPDIGLDRALHRDHPTVLCVNLGPQVQARGASSEAVSETVRERLFALPAVEVAVQCLDADVYPSAGRLDLPPPTDTLYFVVVPRKTGTLRLVVLLLARNEPVHRTTLAVKVSAKPRARKDG